MVNPTIALSNNDVELLAAGESGGQLQYLPRYSAVFCGSGCLPKTVPHPPWLDPGAVGNPALNYFYLMRSVSCMNQAIVSAVGEFDFYSGTW